MLALADRVFLALAWIAGGLAVVMMTTTFSDVVMRYFFNSPIFGAFEVTEISMGLIVFFALPMMIRARENITVTVLFDGFPPALRRAVSVASDITGAGVCALIAWRMWLYGERLVRFREVTLELQAPRGLIAQTMAALMALAALAFLLCAWQALRRGVDPLGSRDSV